MEKKKTENKTIKNPQLHKDSGITLLERKLTLKKSVR